MTTKTTIIIFIISIFCLQSYGQIKIAKKEAIADLDSLKSTIERVHYNPYMHVSRENFYNTIDKLKKSIPDSIGFNTFLLKVYGVTASLNDGHCMPFIVQPEISSELSKKNFLPLKFIFDKNSVFVSNGEEFGIPNGAQILTINGLQVETALKEFSLLFGGSKNFRHEIACRLFAYYLALKGLKPSFDIEYSFDKKVGNKVIDKPITFREAIYKSMPHLSQKNSFKIIDHKTGYINFLSMNGSLDEWGQLLDSAFAEMRKKKVKTLLIDIRNNSGGNSIFANYILAYLTRERFLMSSCKCWRISDDMKKSQRDNQEVNSEYQLRQSGTDWCYESCEPKENPVIADTVFNGKVYLATGAFTFSSANMLADAFKQFKLGILIGEATGEYTNDFGETLLFTLPNSKIKVQTTTSFEYGADCDKQKFKTVEPDIFIKTALPDKLTEKDAIIKYLLKK